jgi:aminoglycoside 6'-N-acetyltransferase
VAFGASAALRLRPLRDEDVPELRRIHSTPEVSRWWGDPPDDFPGDEPEASRWTVEVEGRVAGLIQCLEENEPRYRHASIDLFLDPELHGRGLGTEALRRLTEHLVSEHGHHRITIDPARDNAAAIRSYEKAGFRPVGIMHSYERVPDGSHWRDALLMELVVNPG